MAKERMAVISRGSRFRLMGDEGNNKVKLAGRAHHMTRATGNWFISNFLLAQIHLGLSGIQRRAANSLVSIQIGR